MYIKLAVFYNIYSTNIDQSITKGEDTNESKWGMEFVLFSKCISVRPFLSDKYDLTQHPNYKYTADYDKKYAFDIEKFLNIKAKLRLNDEFVLVEVERD